MLASQKETVEENCTYCEWVFEEIRKNPKDKLPPVYFTVMEKVCDTLSKNIPLRTGDWNIEEVAKINDLIPQCITLKPIVYLVNLDAASFKRKGNKWLVPINGWVNSHGGGLVIPMSVAWEQELWAVKGDKDATEAFLAKSNGQKSVLLCRIQGAQPAVLLHRQRHRGALLDHPCRCLCPRGCWCDPQ